MTPISVILFDNYYVKVKDAFITEPNIISQFGNHFNFIRHKVQNSISHYGSSSVRFK